MTLNQEEKNMDKQTSKDFYKKISEYRMQKLFPKETSLNFPIKVKQFPKKKKRQDNDRK